MFVGNRAQSILGCTNDVVLLKQNGSQTLHTHIKVRIMHLLPAELVLHRIERGSNAGTLRRQREGEVVHSHVLQVGLVAKQLIPIIPEVGRTQLDVRRVRQKEENRGDGSSVHGENDVRIDGHSNLIDHRNGVDERGVVRVMVLQLSKTNKSDREGPNHRLHFIHID